MPPPASSATIISVVAEAISSGLAYGNELQPDTTREVDLLAGLLTRGVEELRASLPVVLARVGVKCDIHAVYCHQSPRVSIRDGGCELGDLLVAVRFQDGGQSTNRALLTQLKIAGRGKPSRAQRALYEKWPRFKYQAWPHAERKVERPIPHAGAQWGLLHLCPRCHGSSASRCGHRVTLDVEMPVEGRTRPFSDEVAGLIIGGGGREFLERNEAERVNGWDRLVWDLIETTGKRLMNYARAQLRERERGQTVSFAAEHRLLPSLVGRPRLLLVSALRDDPDLSLLAELPPVLRAWKNSDSRREPPLTPPWDEAWDARPDGGISLLLFDLGFERGGD